MARSAYRYRSIANRRKMATAVDTFLSGLHNASRDLQSGGEANPDWYSAMVVQQAETLQAQYRDRPYLLAFAGVIRGTITSPGGILYSLYIHGDRQDDYRTVIERGITLHIIEFRDKGRYQFIPQGEPWRYVMADPNVLAVAETELPDHPLDDRIRLVFIQHLIDHTMTLVDWAFERADEAVTKR